MRIIYAPHGHAGEYAELACSLYTTCPHGCRYCYCPGVLHVTREEFDRPGEPRLNVLRGLEADCQSMRERGDTRRVHLCFIGDPYPPHESQTQVTRMALELLCMHGIPAQVLTKGGMCASRDFGLMAEYGIHFGQSIAFTDDADRERWEPNATTLPERLLALEEAHAQGIRTWVSLEPIVFPEQALALIDMLSEYVSEWRVGKLNHVALADSIDWGATAQQVYEALQECGCSYYIKDDLAEYLPASACTVYVAPEAD